ncbi:TRAP transporter small permease [Jeotgalicoccus sp. WY2]|uniref:TRAP transporter small permease n=1 Tax=Jeotgalicoccus sp. WY2 TaxID=2708346 RepID=UPI001BD3430D|nr:TRAP transporter small permease subunit [Jeotgalicoccus sp. WY2]
MSNSNVNEKKNKVINGLIKFQKIFSVIMIILMLSLVFFQVILRSLNLPLMGIEELLILPTIWLYMIGAANASQERSHISVDIIEVFLKNKKLLIILSIIKIL